MRGRYTEGGRRLRALLDATTDAPAAVRAKALTSAAVLLLGSGSFDAVLASTVRSLFEETLTIRRAAGDRRGMAIALHGLGGLHFRLDLAVFAMRAGRYADAAAALAEGASISRRLGDRWAFQNFTTKLAAVARRQADYGARSVLEDLLNAGRDLRDPVLEARGLIALSDVWWAEGDLPMAQRLLEEAVAIARTVDNPWPLLRR